MFDKSYFDGMIGTKLQRFLEIMRCGVSDYRNFLEVFC